ncbi:FMN-dependent NADH-azoreductase [Lacticaseibacillus sp. GG6-2]
MKVLIIKAHPHTTSHSNTLAVLDTFTAAYQQAHPQDELIVRDLFAEPVPPTDGNLFATWGKLAAHQPLTPAEQSDTAKRQALLDEFVGADKYVFASPMYNYALPAELKQYIDVIAIPHATFKYTDHGPVGLLSGKKALHIQAAGGFYHLPDVSQMPDGDFGDPHLRFIMNLFGVTDYTGIYCEGGRTYPDRDAEFLARANEEAQRVAKTF